VLGENRDKNNVTVTVLDEVQSTPVDWVSSLAVYVPWFSKANH
jgi:hypothetical protein